MTRSRRPHATAELSESLHQQLNMYALAAGAAGVSSRSLQPAEDKSDSAHRRLSPYALGATAVGVGLLALAHSAQAKIVYTPANATLSTISVPLDLNHDSVVDFYFSFFSFIGRGFYLQIIPGQNSNEIVDQACQHKNGSTQLCAAALNKDVRVGPKSRFHRDPARGLAMADVFVASGGTSTSFGPWLHLRGQHYLGLKFLVNGQTHYGWARVNTDYRYILTGYAYETIPNKPIIAGMTKGPDVTTVSPARLGHLAAGASAIPAWRVKQTAATTH
jgi:hypothetical protein